MHVPQEGCNLCVTATGGLVQALDERGARCIISHLPEHPDEWMRLMSRQVSVVLPANLAPLVTRVLELPDDPDKT